MNRTLIVILAGAPLALIGALFILSSIHQAAPQSAAAHAPAGPTAQPAASGEAKVSAIEAGALSTPAAAVQSALRYLQANDEGRFRQTLLPAAGGALTPATFALCQKRVAASPPKADWDLAEHEERGHAIVRVRMFAGGPLVGFHDLAGRWLADSLWCAQER